MRFESELELETHWLVFLSLLNFLSILLTIPSPIVVYARSYVPYARSYSDAFLVYRALYQFVAGYKIQ